MGSPANIDPALLFAERPGSTAEKGPEERFLWPFDVSYRLSNL